MKPRRQLLVLGLVAVTCTTIFSLHYVAEVSKSAHIPYHITDLLEVMQRPESHLSYDSLVRKMTLFVRQSLHGGKHAVGYVSTYDYSQLEAKKLARAALVEELTPSGVLAATSSFNFALRDFLSSLMLLVVECTPKVTPINDDLHYLEAKMKDKFPNRDGRVMLYGGHLRESYSTERVRTKEMLDSYLQLLAEEIHALRESHTSFVHKMPRDLPRNLLEHTKLTGYMEGDGIVYLAGGRYNQLVLVSIKMVRDMGSQLPIEVVIKDWNALDARFCEDVLPSLGATCRVIDQYLGSEAQKVKSYQLKNLALLVLSFQRVLYLDADNIVLRNPDLLFANEPFTSTGFVLWPDLWRRSSSPDFYDIAGIQVDANKRVRNSYFQGDTRGQQVPPSYHDCEGAIPEASSETGQLLIDKKKHFATLVLAMYYNYHGFDYFYPLLSQGAAGEGDKETFVAAAHKLGLSYYQVQEFNREFGPLKPSKQHHPFGMGQYDPILDYIQSQNGYQKFLGDSIFALNDKPTCGASSLDSEINNYHYHLYEASRLMFLHANWPKLYFRELFKENAGGRGPINEGKRRRLYGSELIAEAGYDLERVITEAVRWCFCVVNVDLHDVPGVGLAERKEICQRVTEQVDFLQEN